MIHINQQNLDFLTRDRLQFLDYSRLMQEKFSGPSKYFYLKIVDKIKRSVDYPALFDDIDFLEHLYATLATWGMHRMDPGPKMGNFDVFFPNILRNKEGFVLLNGQRLRGIDIDQSQNQIKDLFYSISVMKENNAPKLVANSKIMHFMLPHLIPPIDRTQVLKFFYESPPNDLTGDRSWPIFWELLHHYRVISDNLALTDADLNHPWDTSVPKLIDNAIIGYNIANR